MTMKQQILEVQEQIQRGNLILFCDEYASTQNDWKEVIEWIKIHKDDKGKDIVGLRYKLIQMPEGGCIYKITFNGTHKVYIGETYDFKARVKAHNRGLKGNKHINKKLNNLFNKYSKYGWFWEVVEENVPHEKLKERESVWVFKFDSYYNGCNLKFEDPNGVHICVTNKMVYQYSLEDGFLIKEFPSTKELERQLGFDNASVSACCKNKRNTKTVCGFHFSYEEKTPEQVLEYCEDYIKKEKVVNEVLHLYNLGLTYLEISKKMKRDSYEVYRILKRKGVDIELIPTIHGTLDFSEEDKDEIVRLYTEEETSMRILAERYNTTVGTIKRNLIKKGVQLRSLSESNIIANRNRKLKN